MDTRASDDAVADASPDIEFDTEPPVAPGLPDPRGGEDGATTPGGPNMILIGLGIWGVVVLIRRRRRKRSRR